jgi:serine/threonine protein kinase
MGGLLSSSRKAPVDDALALALLQQVLAGLKGMHARGVIHRDLSPANLLLSSSTTTTTDAFTVRIADLGVATRLTASLPAAAQAAGSLPFMAPEVRRALVGEPVAYDAKADMWSLGAVAYALLTGQTQPNLLHVPPAQAVAEVAALRKWPKDGAGGSVAGRLARLLAWCLQPEPGARPGAAEAEAVLKGESSPRSRL